MDENSPPPESPPLPRKGAYNIDFDNLDEFSNPFESKTKPQMGGSSPPISSSSAYQFDENEDPFKSKTALANSPPGSPKVSPQVRSTDDKEVDMEDPVSVSPAFEQPQSQGSNESPKASSEKETSSQVNPKKKKIIKKPQVQSKFKPPKNLKKQNNSGDIEILMPGMNTDDSKAVTTGDENINNTAQGTPHVNSPQPSPSKSQAEGNDSYSFGEEDGPPPQDAAPDAMALSAEIDRRFIDEVEADHITNGFTGSQEEFRDAHDWTPPDNLDKEMAERANRGSPTSKSSTEHHKKSGDESTDVSFFSQKVYEPTKEKHPAIRALQATQEDTLTTSGKKGVGVTMEKTIGDAEAEENKGTVVQLVQVLRYSQTDWNKMKQELDLNFQTNLLNKERDWSRLLADRDKKISSVEDMNKKLRSTNEDMRAVVTDFEKTIAQLQSEKEKIKSDSHMSIDELEKERNQALEDLSSVETAFSDLHRRYEKSKTIIEGFKRNEEQLKECMEDLKSKLKKSESKLTSLRSQAEEKLDKANEDIEKMKKSTKSDVARLEAALKKSELRISSLDEALSRKEKENEELTSICDELIAKVGS